MYSKGRIAVDWGSCDRYNHITKGPGYVYINGSLFFIPLAEDNRHSSSSPTILAHLPFSS
jgi:hypothetical protein